MNARRVVVVVAIVASVLCLCSQRLAAQNDTDLQAGLKLFGTYQGGDIDSIDTTNTKLVGHIPLWSYAQRGGRLHLNYYIRFGSPSFTQACPPLGDCVWAFAATGLPRVGSDLSPVLAGTAILDAYHHYIGTSWVVTDPDGSTHQMGAIPSSGPTTQIRALDGSGYYANISTWSAPILYDANGLIYNSNQQPSTVRDTNGNQISIGTPGITDSVNRNINPVPIGPTSGVGDGNFAGCSSSATTEKNWTIPGQNNGTVTLQLCFSQTIFSGSVLLTDVVLPNGTAWRFAYEIFQLDDGANHAEVTQVTLPTGGTISYTWGTLNGECHTSEYRVVTSRTVNANDGAGPHTWTYQWQGNYAQARILHIIDPSGNVAVHTTSKIGTGWCAAYETQYQQQDNAGNVLKTVNKTYSYITDHLRPN